MWLGKCCLLLQRFCRRGSEEEVRMSAKMEAAMLILSLYDERHIMG